MIEGPIIEQHPNRHRNRRRRITEALPFAGDEELGPD
jgi:hypothetical protein